MSRLAPEASCATLETIAREIWTRAKNTRFRSNELNPGQHRPSLRLVHMPERSTGSDAVPDQSFDLLDFGKAPLVLARPDHLAVQANIEDAAGDIRGQRHRADANVASSSWAIQPALRPQPQSLQYVISIDGLFGMNDSARLARLVSRCRDVNNSAGRNSVRGGVRGKARPLPLGSRWPAQGGRTYKKAKSIRPEREAFFYGPVR